MSFHVIFELRHDRAQQPVVDAEPVEMFGGVANVFDRGAGPAMTLACQRDHFRERKLAGILLVTRIGHIGDGIDPGARR